MLDLPSSMIIEILTRTPIRDILNCRCVCKSLRDLISDPCFVKDFISRTPFISILLRSHHIYYHLLKHLGVIRNFATKYEKSKLANPKSFSVEMIGCSNGLVCLLNKFSIANSKFYITNPILGEFAVLPNPSSDKSTALEEIYGFFSCRNPGQYKIIKIKTRGAFLQPNRQDYYKKTEVWILGVGSDRWRYIGDAPFPFLGKFCHNILNGRLHWIADHGNKGPINLHSLDITEEKGHPVPAPFQLSCESSGIELGVLWESLFIFDSSRENHLEIWIMREYGVATSWTKDWIVTTSMTASMPLAVQRNMILMSANLGSIFCYDPAIENFTKAYDFHADGKADMMLYTTSFLSLEHVSSGARLKVKKAKYKTRWLRKFIEGVIW